MYKKITYGFVVQEFADDGACSEQSFVAGDQVEYEDADGNPIDVPEKEQYQPFNMEQPDDHYSHGTGGGYCKRCYRNTGHKLDCDDCNCREY